MIIKQIINVQGFGHRINKSLDPELLSIEIILVYIFLS